MTHHGVVLTALSPVLFCLILPSFGAMTVPMILVVMTAMTLHRAELEWKGARL